MRTGTTVPILTRMSAAVHVRAAEVLSQLSNPTRLCLLGELVRRGDDGATLADLAAALELPVMKVGDACSKLLALDVATRNGAGRYVARLAGLRDISAALDELQPITALLGEYPRLRGTFSHGRLVAMPVLYGDLYWQLAEVLARFVALDGPVNEAEINRRLSGVGDDVALLRRMLVETGWFIRDRAGTTYEPSQPVGR
jgi:uncharacterized protein DUF2087